METSIKKAGPVRHEFEVRASSDELEPRIEKELKNRRKDVKMKGFREGKVPISMVKNMYGDQIALQVVEEYIEEAFQEEVVASGAYDILGQPETRELDYEPFGDLRAVIAFDTPPEFELEDVSGTEVTRLVHDVTDEEVEEEIERQRTEHADLIPADGPANEDDFIRMDVQVLDCETGTAVVGEKEQGVELFLNNPRVHDKIKDALIGREEGETVRVELPAQQEGGEMDCYELTVRAVKRRDLPPLDEEFVREVTEGQIRSVEEFRGELKTRLQESWDQRSEEMFESKIVEEMVSRHSIPVPPSLIEQYLDSYVEDVKRQNDGDLPEDFDETAFRESNRDQAEQQARWRFIRDKVAENEEIEVDDDDFQEYYEERSDEEVSTRQLRHYIESMPQMKEQLEDRLLTKKVLDWLADQFDVVEKDRETLEQELQQRREQMQQMAHTEGAEAPDDEAGEVGEEASESNIITPG
jgi:trigger factor